MALLVDSLKLGMFLLALSMTTCEADVKSEFAEDFGTSLRKYYAEMANANMDHLSEFYNLILRDMNLTERDRRGFALRLETIRQMKTRIGDSITEESLKASKQFAKIIFWEVMLYQGSAPLKSDPENLKVIGSALEFCARKDSVAIKEFQEKVHQKWQELYKQLPAAELEQHAEYAEINELLQKTVDVDILKDGESTKEAMKNMLAAFKKITEFFNFKEFKILVE